MVKLSVMQQGVVYLYTALYIYVFQESIKTGINWGAFEWIDLSHLFKKVVRYSATLLLLLPIVFYFISTVLIATNCQLKQGDSFTLINFVLIGLSFLLVFFPLATLNGWALLVRTMIPPRNKVVKIKNKVIKVEKEYGWLHSGITKKDLPKESFSHQMIQFIIIILIIVTVPILILRWYDFVIPFWNDKFIQIFGITYVSILIWMYHTGDSRNYFWHPPKNLLGRRMIFNILHTIILPIIIGTMGVYQIAYRLDNGSFNINYFFLLCFLIPFPFYCNQSTLIFAKMNKWVGESERPEVYQGEYPGVWALFFYLELVIIYIIICLWIDGLVGF